MSRTLFDQVHRFYEEQIPESGGTLDLSDFTLGHMKSLRLQVGDQITLVDGHGSSARAELMRYDRKSATARIIDRTKHDASHPDIWLYISLTKNASRNEWLVEKVTELGVSRIIPLQVEHSEIVHLKRERMQRIMVSAMLQCRRFHLPEMTEEVEMSEIAACPEDTIYLLTHCLESTETQSILDLKPLTQNVVSIFVGPEGDFTDSEVQSLLQKGAIEVSLGDHRLRTETAAMLSVGAVYLQRSTTIH